MDSRQQLRPRSSFLLALLLLEEGRGFLWPTAGVLLVQILVGGLGFLLHLEADLHRPAGSLFENLISGAPPFAPLLPRNLSIVGFIGILAMHRDIHK